VAGVILKNLVKSYGKGKPVLKGIDLEIHEKEFMVLVGPSGCGKSTVLRVVSGLEEVDSGEVWIGDRRVNHVPPRERDVAMVFQNYALYPHMSAYENIAFGLRVRRFPKKEIDKLVHEAASILNLDPLLGKLPKELSGGERQRVALGRAIVRKPKLFLFDEPLSNLDAKLRVQMRAEISALHRRLRITTIYVTHDQVEAMTMGERITVIRSGEIQQIADPLGLYQKPANRFVAEFIGSPPMNIIPVRWEGDALRVGETALGVDPKELGIPDAYRGREVLVGIRPEHLDLSGEGEGIPAQVDLVEPMGGESNVYMTVQGRRTIARLAGDAPVKAGDTARIRFSTASLHFFDPQSERRFSGGPGDGPPPEEIRRPAAAESPPDPGSSPPERKGGGRRLVWIAGAALLLLALVWILGRSGGDGGAPGSAGEPAKVVLWQMMDPEERVVLDEQIALYHKEHPEIRITHQNFGNEDLRTQYITAALGGGGADIVFGPADNAGPFSVAGTVVAVEEAFPPEFLEHFLDIAFDTLGGHKWMLPAQVGNHLCLLYNKELVPEPPGSLMEMIRIGESLTKDTNRDGAPDRYGLVFDLKEPFWLVPFLGAFGGWVMDASYRPTLNTPAMVDALRFMQNMKSRWKVMPKECDYQLADTMFKEGTAAMTVNGHWSWAGYDDAGIDFGIAPIPLNEKTGLWPTPMISSRGYYLNANLTGERRERAMEVMMFLTSREVQVEFARRLWVIPSRRDAFEDPDVQEMERIVNSFAQYEKGRRMPVVPEMRAIWDAMRPAFQNVLNGEATPEEAARAMQADAELKIREMQS